MSAQDNENKGQQNPTHGPRDHRAHAHCLSLAHQSANHGDNQKRPKYRRNKQDNADDHGSSIYCTRCNNPGHHATECPDPHTLSFNSSTLRVVNQSTQKQSVHKVTPITPTSVPSYVQVTSPSPSNVNITTVNGKSAKTLYDTGLDYHCLVSPHLVRPDQITDQTVEIQPAALDMPPAKLKVANIDIVSPYVVGRIPAAILPACSYDLILGNKYLFLGTPSTPIQACPIKNGNPRKQHSSPSPIKRQFNVGDHVLIKSSAHHNNIWTTWAGPHLVTARLTATKYTVNVNGHQRTCHINALKSYEPHHASRQNANRGRLTGQRLNTRRPTIPRHTESYSDANSSVLAITRNAATAPANDVLTRH